MTTEHQKALLATEDYRFHAIGPYGTGTASMATSEQIGEAVFSFGLPSAPALFLTAAVRAGRARRQFAPERVFVRHYPSQGTWPEDHRALFDYFEAYSSEVIFSHTAVEAFANEVIPEDFAYQFKPKKGEAAVTLTKPEIERRVSLDEKLSCVLPLVCGSPNPKGNRIWEAYKVIKEARDRLIHLKSIDRKSSGPEHQTLWGLALIQRGVSFAEKAVGVIGHYQPLVADRRWFTQIRSELAHSADPT